MAKGTLFPDGVGTRAVLACMFVATFCVCVASTVGFGLWAYFVLGRETGLELVKWTVTALVGFVDVVVVLYFYDRQARMRNGGAARAPASPTSTGGDHVDEVRT